MSLARSTRFPTRRDLAVYSSGTSHSTLTIRQTPGSRCLQGEWLRQIRRVRALGWNGVQRTILDRRPALTGGSALLYSIPVSVSGSRIISLCPRRWLRRYGQRLCCPARPGIATRSGLIQQRNRCHPPRRRDRATTLAAMIWSAFWIAV